MPEFQVDSAVGAGRRYSRWGLAAVAVGVGLLSFGAACPYLVPHEDVDPNGSQPDEPEQESEPNQPAEPEAPIDLTAFDLAFICIAAKEAPGYRKVYVALADGSAEPVKLSTPSDPNWLEWAPDGAALGVVTELPAVPEFRNGTWSLYIFGSSTDTREPTLIYSEDFYFDCGPILRWWSWSPDGSLLAYLGDRGCYYGCANKLYVSSRETGQSVEVSGSLDPGGNVLTLRWSPGGTRLAFSAWGQCYVTLADGTQEPVAVSSESCDSFAWSPDGTRLAILEPGLLRVLPMDGNGEPVSLAVSSGADRLKWSADGTRLAFTAVSDDSGRADLFVARAAGTDEPVRVSDTMGAGDTWDYAWSPDGTHLAYRLNSSLYVSSADGSSAPVRLGNGVEWGYKWSPDGTFLGFTANHTLYVAPVADGQPIPLSGELAVGGWGWSPAGGRLSFRTDLYSEGDLYVVSAHGGEPLKVNGAAPMGPHRQSSWSPSGARLAFIGADGLYVTSPDGDAEPVRVNDELIPGTDVRDFRWSPLSE